MAKDVEVRCRCGEVTGLVTNASPQKVNRVVCYCDDCQAFAHQLGRADLLNAQGGSDIVQVAPASLAFMKGQNRIAGVRLTPKGLFRWHTTCCNTNRKKYSLDSATIGGLDRSVAAANLRRAGGRCGG